MLYTVIIWSQAVTISSSNWNTSEGQTSLGSTNGSGGMRTAIYELKNPTATSSSVVVTFSSNPTNGGAVYVFRAAGCDTTNGARAAFTRNDGTGTGPGLTVTNSQANDLVIHSATVFNSSITWGAGETATQCAATDCTYDKNIVGSSFSGGFSYKTAAGTNETVDATDVASYSEVAIAIPVASASKSRSACTLLGVCE